MIKLVIFSCFYKFNCGLLLTSSSFVHKLVAKSDELLAICKFLQPNLMKRKLYSLEEALKHPKHAQELTIFLDRESADLNRIGELSNLKTLSLLDNPEFTEIPTSVYTLPLLYKIKIRNTGVQNLSEQLGQLQNLNHLEVNNSPLVALPKSIGQLKKLNSLYLYKTALEYLPESIGKTSISRLHIEQSPLKALPQSIGQLKFLQSLELQNNQLSELPDSLAQLPKLHWVYLHHNNFRRFPAVLTQISSIKGIFLDHNQLQEINSSMKQLKQLDQLSLSHNRFKEFPRKVLEIENLLRLELDHNQLTALPEDFFQFKSLNYLNIQENAFEEFPFPLLSWYQHNNAKRSYFYYDQKLSNHKNIDRMLQGKTFQRLSQKEQEAFFFIYTNNQKKIKELDITVLWKALNSAAVDISAVTLALMTEQFENKAIQRGDSIYLAGKLTMDAAEFNTQLAACELTLSNKMEEATHVLISARGNKKPRKWPKKSDWSWISEAQLMAFFDEINPSFLVESAETDADKVSHFILSMDEDNMALGMGLIEGGGLPEALFTEAFIVYKLAEDPELRKKAKELLKAKASPELLTVLKNQAKLNRKGYLRESVYRQLEQRVQDYCKNSGLDLGKLAYAMYMKNKSCLALALDHSPSELRMRILQQMIRQDELYLNYRARLTEFPLEILEIPGLKRLTLYAQNGYWQNGQHINNSKFKLPEGIEQLKNLEYLHIGYTFTELPIESLQKLPKLQTLSLNVRNLELKQALEKALPNCTLNIYYYQH